VLQCGTDDTGGSVSLDGAYDNGATIDFSGGRGSVVLTGDVGGAQALRVINTGTGGGLFVENAGTGDSFIVFDSATTDASPFVINASGNVGIGTTSTTVRLLLRGSGDVPFIRLSDTAGAFTDTVDIHNNGILFRIANVTDTLDLMSIEVDTAFVGFGTTDPTATLTISGDGSSTGKVHQNAFSSSGSAFKGSYIFRRARGSEGSESTVETDDQMGEVLFQGWDGDEFVTGANIIGLVDGSPGNNDMPGSLEFKTTPDGASSPVTRLTISQTGNVGIGDSTPAALLTVGDGDLFQVNTTGVIAAAAGITSSGTITFSSLTNCDTIDTVNGVLQCGTDDSGGSASLDGAYDNGATITVDATNGPVTLTGNLGGSNLMIISNSGTGNSLRVDDPVGVAPFVIDTLGRLGVGTTNPASAIHILNTSGSVPELRIETANQLKKMAQGMPLLLSTIADLLLQIPIIYDL